jgi:hypothetical protein
LVVEAWLRRAMLDYFVGFQLEHLVNYRLFPLHQGIEKLCKAYLLARHAEEWTALEPEEARVQWIEDFVKRHGHDLWVLVRKVGENLTQVAGYVTGKRDKSFLDLLTMAYEESRYPKPIGQSIWDKHGYPALVTHLNEEQAYALGSAILDGITSQFGICYLLAEPIASSIKPEDWQRFLNVWNLRRARS